ncbi:hypothetical protein AB0L06_13970 [Spirillospora sp. NPDC052269]
MTDQQPGDLIDEAAKLLDAVRRRVGDAARAAASGSRPALDDDDEDVWARVTKDAPGPERARGRGEPRVAGESDGEDVWAQVLAEEPHVATGAPECRNCPVCRAIALARESGPDVRRHVEQAGRSLLAALSDVVAAYGRTRSGRSGGDTTDIG